MDLDTPRRLDKYLADARVGSRSQIEAWAADGAIAVNGVETRALTRLVDPGQDLVALHRQQARLTPPTRYALLHKPHGVLTTLVDVHDRRSVAALLPPGWFGRVGVVGRLDQPTTGALLITDDGDLNHLLTDPGCQVWKRYLLTIVGEPDDDDPRLATLRAGVTLSGERTRPARCHVVPGSGRPGRGDARLSELRVEVCEGRFRQVRRMAGQVGLKLVRLHREAIGPLPLGDLAVGSYRLLLPAEVDALYAAAGGRDAPAAGARAALRRRWRQGELSAEDAAIVERFFATRRGLAADADAG